MPALKYVVSTEYNTAASIMRLHNHINELSAELKEHKKEYTEKVDILKKDAERLFSQKMGPIGEGSAPKVYGNFYYVSEEGSVGVNYRMKPGGLTLREIAGLPANDVLKTAAGDYYNKLFSEEVVLDETREDLVETFKRSPELVDMRLRPSRLPEEVIQKLLEEYPDAFDPQVKDVAAYLKAVPDANKVTEVSLKKGFISNVAALPEDVSIRMGDFIRKVLLEHTTQAVKCNITVD